MTIKDYMEQFAEEHEHDLEPSTILKYINLVEANVFSENIKDYRVQTYPRTKDAYQYDLPEGVDFTDVVALWVNGIKYKKKDVRAYHEYHSYWYEGGKLCIYPACSESDTGSEQNIRLVYQHKPAPKVIANIATDELLIPLMFQQIYDFFILQKIAYNRKFYSEAQNHATSYNAEVGRYEDWWENHRPLSPLDSIQAEYERYEQSSFDTE
jgi:hypothetical protein